MRPWIWVISSLSVRTMGCSISARKATNFSSEPERSSNRSSSKTQ